MSCGAGSEEALKERCSGAGLKDRVTIFPYKGGILHISYEIYLYR